MSDSFAATLAQLRREIDAIDDELVALLKRRIRVVGQVAELKRAHAPASCHIRPGREGAMHRRIFDTFTGEAFPPTPALGIWRQIIGASTHLESPITVAIAGSGSELRWHAREYFGRNVSFVDSADTASALRAVDLGEATIALLPAPTDATLADWATLRQHPSLRIFAALPMVLAPGESPAAYAAAAVPLEPSGDDRSLLLLPAHSPATGHILAHDAAYTLVSVPGISDDDACIGTLPTPIIDSLLTPW